MASESTAATRSPTWILRWPDFVVLWANDHALRWWCLTDAAEQMGETGSQSALEQPGAQMSAQAGAAIAHEPRKMTGDRLPNVPNPGNSNPRSPLSWPAPVSDWLRSLVTTYQDLPQPVTPGHLTCPVATALGWRLMPCTVALMGADHAIPPLWVIEGMASPGHTEVVTWAQVPNTPTPAAPSPTWWEDQNGRSSWSLSPASVFPGARLTDPVSDLTAPDLTAPDLNPPGLNPPKLQPPDLQPPDLGIQTPSQLPSASPDLSSTDLTWSQPRASETIQSALSGPSLSGAPLSGIASNQEHLTSAQSPACSAPTIGDRFGVPMLSPADRDQTPWYSLGDILTQLTASEDVNADIDQALAQLGAHLLVNRLGVFRYHQHPVSEAPLASYRWEWCSAAVEPQLNNLELQNVTLQQLPPEWHERLQKGQWATYECAAAPKLELSTEGNAEETPEVAAEMNFEGRSQASFEVNSAAGSPASFEAKSEDSSQGNSVANSVANSQGSSQANADRNGVQNESGEPSEGEDALPLNDAWFLRVQQVCWAIAVPIPIGGQLWGFLMAGRDQTQRPWQGMESVMLQTVACGLGNAIARHQSQVALRSFNQQIESVIQQRTFKFRAAIQQLQQEIRDRQRAEDQLRYTTFHDALTGLPNRMSLIHTLNQVIAEVQLPMSPEVQAQRAIALVLIDIDRLEVVNNTMGHAMGDELLAAIADRLQRQLPEDYFVARFGGDEFAILAEGVTHVPAAEQLASQVQTLFLKAFPVDGQDLFTSATLGIALSDPDYKRPESMLRDADIAMRRAKRTGGGNYAIFDRTIHQNAITDLYLETELRRAIQALGTDPTHTESGMAHCQFFLTYQPVVETQTQRIRGFEALVRWQHPDLGLVSPAQFIPIAEKTGAIVPLGNWILYQACRQLQQWQAQAVGAIAPLEMAVNLSCRQFAQPDLIAQVERAIADHTIPPATLKLEITESTIMEGSSLAKRTLTALRSRGMQLCMDDFGTGYSSLSYLHRLPLDVLKIDRAFVMRLGQRGENTAIIRTIITLAQHFGLKVVAEGVETTQQLKLLRSLGCEFVQGYLFSRPLSAPEATELLVRQHRNPQVLWGNAVQSDSVHQT